MNSLPLSWSIVIKTADNLETIKNRHFEWLATPQVSESYLKNEIDGVTEKNLIIRGCNEEHMKHLKGNGFYFSQFGMEAVLDTSEDHFNKKSLMETIRRGKKHGRIIILDFSQKNKLKLEKFRAKTVHGNFPQLKNLFQSEFKPNNLLLVYIDKNEKWLGAILLSKNSKTKLHTELLLRMVNAPVGIMESLVERAFHLAKNMGYKQISLGEVPFISKRNGFDDYVSLLSFHLGKFFSFAYNYDGLYNFKNKFRPSWEEVYICSNKKIRIRHLFFLFSQSQFHKLAIKKLLYIFFNKFFND